MKFELSDKAVFGLSAAACGSIGASVFAAPRKLQDIYWDGEKGRNDCGVRTHGLTTTTTAVLIGLCAKDGTLTAQGKKDAHKVCAGAWGAFAGLHGYHVYTKKAKQDAYNIANVAAAAALTGAHAYMAFKKDKKKEEKKADAKPAAKK